MDNLAKSSNEVFYSASSPEGASLLNMVLTDLNIKFHQTRYSGSKGIEIRFFVVTKDDKLILTEIDKLLGVIRRNAERLKQYNFRVSRYEKLFLLLGPMFN